MEYRRLGRTGLDVSRVSLGTGGPSRIGQRTHQDEAKSHRLIHRALELGVNLFDTAAAYSNSEAILGRALRDVSRDQYFLATKFTPTVAEGELEVITPEQMIDSCERSLQRLNVDAIDVFQFHGLVPENYRPAVERLYPTALRLQEQGKVRFLGVTEFFFNDPSHRMLLEALAQDIWDTVMVKYGILNLTAEDEVLPMARARDVGVFNMSAVRAKLSRPDQLEQLILKWKSAGLIDASALPDTDPLGFLVCGEVKSVVAAGYKFGAANEALSTVLIGTGDAAHLEENISTILGPPLPDDHMDRIRQIFGGVAESERD
ncbi:MAG: aldo/keto reductase [Pirellulaceae bacterium]|nr:aldo/keto reductase [Pirellulaceae bacterium]MDP7017728.1 aldo/keto reductase [Pirellulaceae bacterium]